MSQIRLEELLNLSAEGSSFKNALFNCLNSLNQETHLWVLGVFLFP